MAEETITHVNHSNGIGFIETFLGTLIAPLQTFKQLAEECQTELAHLPFAFGIVILVFALDALRLTPANQIGMAVLNVPLEVTGGLTLWLLSAAVVGLAALCFGVDSAKVRAAFVTLAWSLLPWIFMGPIACFWKILGQAHVLLMSIPLAWILFLQIIAVKQSFQMKAWQALVLVLVVPTLMSWYQLMQFLQTLAATLASMIS